VVRQNSDRHPGHPSQMSWPEIDGMVQVVMAVYVKGEGWLWTRRGMIYGGRHGEPPTIEKPEEALFDIVALEVKTGLRAMRHTYQRHKDGDHS